METKPALSAAVVEVLKQDNYQDWSVRVKTYLMAQDLWDIVESRSGSPTPENEAASKVWSKTNAMALHVIQNSCGPDTFSDIREITSARIAWETLAEKYKPKGLDPSGSMASVPLEEDNLDSITELGESGQEGNIDDGVEFYTEFYIALQIGDGNAANVFLKCHPHAISAKITVTEKTALHVAAEAGHVHIGEELVQKMSKENLEIKDFKGFTALARAACNGNYRIAECMLEKNQNLIRIVDDNGNIPVVRALYNGHLKLSRYLYSLTAPLGILVPENGTMGASVFSEAIYNKALDIALDLVSRCPRLVLTKDRYGDSPFYALACMPDYLSRGNRLVFWKRWIYSGIHIQLVDPKNDICLNIEKLAGNKRRSNGKEIIGSGIYSLSQLVSKLQTLLGIEHLYEMKLAHVQYNELLRQMKKQILISNIQQRNTGSIDLAILRAIKEGIFEFVFEMVKADPQNLWSHDEKSTSIFSVAVQYRHAKIFSLIYGLDIISALTSNTDEFYGNNLLHMAGMSAPSTSLDRIAGAALQMQRELQWFKEVESIVPPNVHSFVNKEGLTPRELFTKNHKDMRKDGEQWMKDTATSCTVVDIRTNLLDFIKEALAWNISIEVALEWNIR
ncbi:hypothetical protein SO802_009629 [Lithocarpus litseifolius]|uniref:DUF4219 domain-containing protein n=1 Tax=Lithocarpus litseifolius TaxID=425828 RepID=A0AAW2DCH8_9ROSI